MHSSGMRTLVDRIPASTVAGGVCTCGGGDTCPGTPPPVNRMTDRQLLKHNLRKLRLRVVKIEKSTIKVGEFCLK